MGHSSIQVTFDTFSSLTRMNAAANASADPLSEGFRHFVASMPAPVASGWSDIAGWGLHPLESAALSRRTPESVARAAERLRALMPTSVISCLGLVSAEISR
jgi:hypothetical protein